MTSSLLYFWFYTQTKEVNFCHILKFSNTYICVIWWCKPFIFQTLTVWSNIIHSLKYQRSATLQRVLNETSVKWFFNKRNYDWKLIRFQSYLLSTSVWKELKFISTIRPIPRNKAIIFRYISLFTEIFKTLNQKQIWWSLI